jgi:nucleotide-binding universal stress UspA family protein
MKILLAYDGSETAEAAMQDLANAGLPRKAEAIVLVAIPPMLPLGSLVGDAYAVEWYADAYTVALKNRLLDESRAKAKGHLASRRLKKLFPGWKITLESSLEIPSHAILERADGWKPDLLVLGSHGWNPLGKLLLGSVSEKVLTHAHGNVRIGKSRRKARSGPLRILIGFDGSRESLAAVGEVAGRNWPAGTSIRLVAVSDFQLRLDEINLAVQKAGTAGRNPPGPWAWMEARLEKAVRMIAQPGVKVASSILEGDPRHALLAEAVKFKADAIFLGNRGLTGMKRFMLGSVSTAIASHSPCTVEIIRAADKR